MSITVRGLLETLDLRFWWEGPAEGREVVCHDPSHARSLVRRLLRDHATALRRFAAPHLSAPAARIDDAEVVEHLARWIAAGSVKVVARPLLEPRLFVPGEDEEEAAPVPMPRAPVPEQAPPKVDPPSFTVETDLVALAASLVEAAARAVPFCEVCAKRRALDRPWVAIRLVDESGAPVPGERFRIGLPDGSVREGITDELGTARVDGIDPGTCVITFPALDAREWEPV